MAMIKFVHKGKFKKTKRFLTKAQTLQLYRKLGVYGRRGVLALASATPLDTGNTAFAWDYEIEVKGDKVYIFWTNDNVESGVNIALILQYGHGTGTGGYVEGIDYINPAIRPIFDQIVYDAWKEVIVL